MCSVYKVNKNPKQQGVVSAQDKIKWKDSVKMMANYSIQITINFFTS